MIKAKIERDPVDYSKMVPELLQVLKDVAEDVRLALTEQPPETEKHLGGPLPGGFYSEKQRRYVHWGIKSGAIRVPYLRTGKLAKSWTVSEVQVSGGTASIEVYSDPTLAPYNRYVQDPLVRPPMHADWPVVDREGWLAAQEGLPRLNEVCAKYGFTSR